MNETKEKLEKEKISREQSKEKLKKEIISHEETKEKLEKEIERLNNKINKEEANQSKRDIKESKDIIDQTKSKMKNHTYAIVISGSNNFNQLAENLHNKDNDDLNQIISPLLNLLIDPSSLLSYSIYGFHSVQVTKDFSLKGIGYNNDGRITSSLQKTAIDHFTDFSIKDDSDLNLDPISAVCSVCGTLYMFSKISGSGRQLVLCDKDINGGDPVFLNIGNHHPVALFGGFSHSAAIGNEGEVIFINRYLVKNSPKTRIESIYHPDDEEASSVACCEDSVVVLSLNGRVFSSPIEFESRVLRFSEVDELSGKEIVCISGTLNHILAVSKEGQVFGSGSNQCGQLGLGKGISTVSSVLYFEYNSPISLSDISSS